jgi:two-component system OmpR family sensor kinase
MRSIYRHATGHDGAPHVLQAAASTAPIRRVQRELIAALAAIVLLGGAVTMVGAWRLADTAVRPVAEITEQAMQLKVGTLDHRIHAHATVAEYSGLVAVLNGMLERLDAAFRAQRRLTADVSHELRTPLTALRGEIEVTLRKVRAPEDYQRALRSVLEEIESMVELTEELLLVTRADANLVPAERHPVEVDTIVREAVDRLAPRLQGKGVRVELDLAAPLARVDGVLLARLVDHLLENAMMHAPPKGRVHVTTVASDGGLRLAVHDSGPGIAEEDLPHLFEPFYRADEARTRGAGFGLGLTVAAAVARLHGGTITATNAPGGGARLEVDLPAAPAS